MADLFGWGWRWADAERCPRSMDGTGSKRRRASLGLGQARGVGSLRSGGGSVLGAGGGMLLKRSEQNKVMDCNSGH